MLLGGLEARRGFQQYSPMSRLLFVTLSNIGDLVLTTPALMALHAAFPHARVDIVADRRSSELLRHSPFLGTLFHRDKQAGIPGLLRLLRELRRTRYDAVIDLRTDWLPMVIRARQWSSRRRANARAEHSAAQHLEVVRALLGNSCNLPPARVWFDRPHEARARELLAGLPGRRLVIAPGANWAPKCWPAGHFAACANHLRDAFDSLVVLGGPADVPVAAALRTATTQPLLDLAGQTSLCEAAAVLHQCSAFIGNDSGLGHIAAAVGLPVVTVFGPGNPARYRPWGTRTAVCLAPENELAQLDPAVVAGQLRQLLTD